MNNDEINQLELFGYDPKDKANAIEWSKESKKKKAEFKKKLRQQKSKEEAEIVRNRENEWFRDNVQTDEQKQVEQKTKVEKGRYITALKNIIKEKGCKLNPLSDDMPNLCQCGAMIENLKIMQKGKDSGI